MVLIAGNLEAGRRFLAAGRLREAQDEYLQVLIVVPDHEQAMRDLVTIRRRLGRGDAALLRRQAAAYRHAVERGEETEEHYTAAAMLILAQASILAAQQIDEAGPTPRGAGPPPIVLPATPAVRATATPAVRATATPPSRQSPVRPTPRATRRPTPRPTARVVSTPAPPPPAAPAPATRAPTPPPTPQPTPQPSLDVNEPFFLIQIGPIADALRASAIVADLTVSGYTARVSRSGSAYVITLGPYRQSVVDAILKTLRARFGSSLPVTVNPAP